MRYIDADDLIKKMFPIGLVGDGNYPINARSVKYAIDHAPTADVVPKSEVERAYYNLQAVLEERAETKREIAREIFEEIEFDIHQLMFERDETRAIAIEGIIAALKKKYTGGQSDG